MRWTNPLNMQSKMYIIILEGVWSIDGTCPGKWKKAKKERKDWHWERKKKEKKLGKVENYRKHADVFILDDREGRLDRALQQFPKRHLLSWMRSLYSCVWYHFRENKCLTKKFFIKNVSNVSIYLEIRFKVDDLLWVACQRKSFLNKVSSWNQKNTLKI